MADSSTHFDDAAKDWDSEPRRVALMKAIGQAVLREAAPTDATDVLDYGCGTGLVGRFLLPHVRSVTGADNSEGMLRVLRERIARDGLENMEAIRLDLERDPAPATRYHLITVGMAMHHIADTDKVLRAFHDLLLPGGALCLADLDTEPGTFHPPRRGGHCPPPRIRSRTPETPARRDRFRPDARRHGANVQQTGRGPGRAELLGVPRPSPPPMTNRPA